MLDYFNYIYIYTCSHIEGWMVWAVQKVKFNSHVQTVALATWWKLSKWMVGDPLISAFIFKKMIWCGVSLMNGTSWMCRCFSIFHPSKQLLPSISGTDVQKHVTCDDQNARWWQLVRYVTWLVWGLHYLQRIGHQFVQCLLVSDVWRWFCPCKSLGMLFVIYHIYIYTYTYTILYNIYI